MTHVDLGKLNLVLVEAFES